MLDKYFFRFFYIVLFCIGFCDLFGQLLLSRVMLLLRLLSLRKPCVGFLPDLLVLGRDQIVRSACNGSVDLRILLV